MDNKQTMMFREQVKEQLYRKLDDGFWECKCCSWTGRDLDDLLNDENAHQDGCLAARLTWAKYEITIERTIYDQDRYPYTEFDNEAVMESLSEAAVCIGRSIQISVESNEITGKVVKSQIVIPLSDEEEKSSDAIIDEIANNRLKEIVAREKQKKLKTEFLETKNALAVALHKGILTEEEYKQKLAMLMNKYGVIKS